MTIMENHFLKLKPMQDVIFHHPKWIIHCGDATEIELSTNDEVKNAAEREKIYPFLPTLALSIEAIPETRTEKE